MTSRACSKSSSALLIVPTLNNQLYGDLEARQHSSVWHNLVQITEQIAASNVPSADLRNTFLLFCSPSPNKRLNHASQTPTGDTVIILAMASLGAI